MTLDIQKLAQAIGSLQPEKLAPQAFYRSADLGVLSSGINLLDGSHAGLTGGRFNTKRGDPILYAAGSQTLASWESEQGRMLSGLAHIKTGPRIVVTLWVKNIGVLNLTNPMVVRTLGLNSNELLTPSNAWQSLNQSGAPAITQIIGDIVRQAPQFDGLLAPSWLASGGAGLPILPRSFNLVAFMDPKAPDQPLNRSVSISVYDPRALLP